MSLGARIEAKLNAIGLTPAELARRVGVRQSTMNSLIRGDSHTSRSIVGIARELGTTVEYLMGDSDDPALPHGVSRPADQRDLGEQRVAWRGKEPEGNPDAVELDMVDMAYGLGGTFLDVGEAELEKATFSRAWLRQFSDAPPSMLFSAKGVGDSMMPTIHDRDVIIIDRLDTRPRMRDQIWAIAQGQIGMVKRLRPMPDGVVRIISDNPAVSEDVTAEDELHIVGRVVAICRKV